MADVVRSKICWTHSGSPILKVIRKSHTQENFLVTRRPSLMQSPFGLQISFYGRASSKKL